MYVIKYNGDREVLDISKIHKVTQPACEGLNNVSQSELEADASITFRDGIKTSDIQSSLIKTAVDKIDIDRPDWTYVASRLLIADIYSKVNRIFGHKPTLAEYLRYGEDNGAIVKGISDIYRDSLDELNDYLDFTRDDEFTYIGLVTILGKDLLKVNGEVFESPQHMFMGIAMFLAQLEDDKIYWTKKFYDILSTFVVMASTPTLSNARKPRSQCSSCYIGVSPDNAEGLLESNSDQALLSKYGGGLGWSYSLVRGTGRYIDGNPKASGGVIPPLKVADSLMINYNQLGTRPGALAPYIETFTIDILDFIDLKKNSGEERRRTHNLFPALWISDLFMERVAEDTEWTLFSPDEVKELIPTYGDEFKTKYEEFENDDSVYKERISAKRIWKEILRSYFETGAPFLGFRDAANKANPNKHKGFIYSSNLCVTGDTRLATQHGLMTAKDLYDSQKPIIATYDKRVDDEGLGVSTAECLTMHLTAENADIYKLTTSHGYEIKSTGWHEYYVDRAGEGVIKIQLNRIAVDDKLLVQSDKGQFTDSGVYEDGVEIANSDIASLTPSGVGESVFRGSEDMVKGYLHTLHNSIGELTYTTGEVTITFRTPNIELLKDVQILLSNFGIVSKRSQHELTVENVFVGRYVDYIGFINGYEQPKLLEQLTLTKEEFLEDFLIEIDNIECIGKQDVYDTTQFLNHSVIFNGLVTGQCTEIMQNTSPGKLVTTIYFEDGDHITRYEYEEIETDVGIVKQASKLCQTDYIYGKRVVCIENNIEGKETAVCNLASVNMSRVRTPEDLKQIVPTAIRMLDNVIDLNFYPLKSVRDTNLKTRAIGLGLMGQAERLATAKIHFGSDEHKKFIDEYAEAFSYYAIKASMELAEEKSPYPQFNGSDWSKGIFPIDKVKPEARELVHRDLSLDWKWLKSKVIYSGMRNGYLMAVAPTSTISLLTGTTSSIEAIYKRKYFEENLTGMIPVVVPKLSPDTWEYYQSAYDIDITKQIEATAILQKFIDQGISLNVHLRPETTTGKVLNEIYMTAWRLGLKSCYYLRSKSPEINDINDDSVACEGCQ